MPAHPAPTPGPHRGVLSGALTRPGTDGYVYPRLYVPVAGRVAVRADEGLGGREGAAEITDAGRGCGMLSFGAWLVDDGG